MGIIDFVVGWIVEIIWDKFILTAYRRWGWLGATAVVVLPLALPVLVIVGLVFILK